MQYSYYDLTDQSKIPENSKYVDPYDHTTFTATSKTETLDQFINRIISYRQSKGFPEIFKTDLYHLVLASLYQSSTPDQRKAYFSIRTVPPSLTQLVSLSKSMATEIIHGNNVSAKHREERAAKCNDNCRFHNTSSSWRESVKNAIVKIVGLDKLNKSEEESKLGNCMMCGGCSLQGKVRFEIMSIIAGLPPEYLDKLINVYGIKAFDKCWILQDSINNLKTREILQKKLANGKANGAPLLQAYLTNKEMKALQPPPQPIERKVQYVRK